MLRYKRLAYVALNVSDLQRSCRFYENVIGLRPVREHADASATFVAGGEQRIALHQGEKPGLKSLGWQLENDEGFERLNERLRRQAVRTAPMPSALREACLAERCVRISEPHSGAILDFFVSAPRPAAPAAGPVDGLGHVVLRVAAYQAAVRFFEDVLDFRRSDEVDGWISFLRCFPNPLHHSIALASGARNMLHHVNFSLRSAEDVRAAAQRFRNANVAIMSGPGRHPPSRSTFLYFLDPDGLTLEYGHGMERFPEHAPRAPRVLPAVPESLDYDASPRDPRMYLVGEIETQDA